MKAKLDGSLNDLDLHWVFVQLSGSMSQLCSPYFVVGLKSA